jgi:hypothetical protein
LDQLYLVDKTKDLASWGLYSKEVQATFRDIRAAAGEFFRMLGNESFKPQLELRIIARI